MLKLTDNCAMPYGKYKGRQMCDVPADYLLWLHENDKCSDSVTLYVCDNHQSLEHRRKVELEIKSRREAIVMPFGAYKGVALPNVDAEYLLVLYESDRCPKNIAIYIKQNLDEIEARAEKDRNDRALLRSMCR